MAPWKAGTLTVVILALLCDVVAACVVPLPAAPPGPTEVDRAYYYSTIVQEMIYAKIVVTRPAEMALQSVERRGSGSLSAACGMNRPLGVRQTGAESTSPYTFCPMSLGTLCPPPSHPALQPSPQDLRGE